MALKPIETQRLYQKVADQIAGLIREGQWAFGQRLPSERDMAQELGVSRPVVREAMIALGIVGQGRSPHWGRYLCPGRANRVIGPGDGE